MEGFAKSVSAGIQLEVGLVQDVAGSNEGLLHIRVGTEEKARRVPMNIVCLVDTSGSMCERVSIQNADGTKEVTMLNMLDLAKHSVRTVAHGLNEEDMLSVIGWSSDPDPQYLHLTKMDASGREAADRYLDRLRPSGMTGMDKALTKGFDVIEDNGRPSAIFLLTDGLPNDRPKNGFGNFVKDLMDKSGKDVTVNTFGFGYSVDSKLLMDIAQAGHGTFSFIPDAGLLGTVMVNSLANTLLSVFSDTQVGVELCDGISFTDDALTHPKGSLVAPIRNADGSVVFNIGTVHFEQPRSVVVPVRVAPGFRPDAPVASVSVSCFASGKRVNVELEDAVTQVLPAMRLSYSTALAARAKTLFADALFNVVFSPALSETKSFIEESSAQFKACAAQMNILLAQLGDNAAISDIIRDCEGQSLEAVSRLDWFTRWGVHYLRSLCAAHEYELCNNFKDPGVQHYGGELFARIRDDLDDIFQSLPPPTNKEIEANEKRARERRGQAAYYAPAPVSMSRFMDRYSGCFAGSCNVTMADGTTKRVSDVCKGDILRTGSEENATVVCVIEHPAAGEVCVLSPSGLIITPWHPIEVGGKWSFPANYGNSVRQPAKEPVFTFVLDRVHSVAVNGIKCVTLSHGITSGSDARAHAYFGSDACITDLKKHFSKEYEAGHVTIPANCQFVRDPTSKLVTSLSF